MKIKEIFIKNFRSIKDEHIIFPQSGILALVGPNNAGKSNILKTIENMLGDSWFNGEKAELNDFYNKDRSNIIEIRIIFDNEYRLEFSSDQSRAKYYNGVGDIIYSNQGNVKDDFPCTYLPANRGLEKSLGFRSYELMGKIAKTFNNKAQAKKADIEGKFNEIMEIFDEIEGFTDFKNDVAGYFNEIQSDCPYKLKVSFKAFTPLNYFKTLNLLANDTSINDEFDIDVNELGEGNKSLLMFALVRSYAKNFKQEATGVLAIEEPEIYLHPQARRYLYNIFQEITNTSNVQIIYTTHSPDFIDTENFHSIGLVNKSPEFGTKVKIVTKDALVQTCLRTGVPSDRINIDNIQEFYSVTSNFKLNEGFFAKKLILVEGDTEELCLPLLLGRLGNNCNAEGISIIGVGGKNQLPKYRRLFKKFGIDTSIVFDSDSQGNNNIASCFACSIEDIQNNIEITKTINTTHQRLVVFQDDFETAFKLDFNNNDARDMYYQEAVELIKPIMKQGKADQSKGQVARYVTKKILDNHTNYTPTFIENIL